MEIQSQLMRHIQERLTRSQAHRMVIDMFAMFLDYSEVLASKLVEGTGLRYDVDGYHSTVPEQEVYSGQAGFLSRAQDGAECVVWNAGGESIVIATKDRRYEVALEAGDVVVHSMPSDVNRQATIRLDGSTGDVHVTMPAGAKQTVTAGGSPTRVATIEDVKAVWNLLATAWTPTPPANGVDNGASLKLAAQGIYNAAFQAAMGSPALESDD